MTRLDQLLFLLAVIYADDQQGRRDRAEQEARDRFKLTHQALTYSTMN